MTQILRYAAFTDDPAGGNPAGVVLDATGLDDPDMAAIAARVGYSETAFLEPTPTAGSYRVRYFSPVAEVPFCGHATIAAAVALADRNGAGPLLFHTAAGPVPVRVTEDAGRLRATLTSVATSVAGLPPAVLADLLAALGWSPADLDPALPPRVAYAGAYHPVIAAATRGRLADLRYDVPALTSLMTAQGWTTVQLIWRADAREFHVRNPFPVGGVYEDPATGAAAAALGGYLRALGLVPTDAALTLRQGEELGRPGLLRVVLRDGEPGVQVSGAAVALPG